MGKSVKKGRKMWPNYSKTLAKDKTPETLLIWDLLPKPLCTADSKISDCS